MEVNSIRDLKEGMDLLFGTQTSEEVSKDITEKVGSNMIIDRVSDTEEVKQVLELLKQQKGEDK